MEKTLSAKKKTLLAFGAVLLVFFSAFSGYGSPTDLNVIFFFLAAITAAAVGQFIIGVAVAAPFLGMVLNLLLHGSELSAAMSLYCVAPALGLYAVKREKARRQTAVMGSSVAVTLAFFAAFVYVVYRNTSNFSLESCKTVFSSQVDFLERYISSLVEAASENLANASMTSVETMLNLLLCLLPVGFFILVYLIVLLSFNAAKKISGSEIKAGLWDYSNSIVTVVAAVLTLAVAFFVSKTPLFVAMISFVFIISTPLAVEGIASLRKNQSNGRKPVGRIMLMVISLFINYFLVPVLAVFFGAKDTVSRTVMKFRENANNKGESPK